MSTYDRNEYQDRESILREIKRRQREKGILDSSASDKELMYNEAFSTGQLNGREVKAEQLERLRLQAEEARRLANENDAFVADASADSMNVPTKAEVKTKADADQKVKDDASVKERIAAGYTGIDPAVPETPESRVITRARGYAAMPREDFGLLSHVFGTAPIETNVGFFGQAINPFGLLTTGFAPEKLAALLTAPEVGDPTLDPTAMVDIDPKQPLNNTRVAPSNMAAERDNLAEKYAAQTTGDVETRVAQGTRRLNSDAGSARNRARQAFNARGRDNYNDALGMNAIRLGSGIGYGTLIANALGAFDSDEPAVSPPVDNLGNILRDTDKISPEAFNAWMSKYEGLRTGSESMKQKLSELAASRESGRKEVAGVLRGILKVDPDSALDDATVDAMLTQGGLKSPANMEFVTKNRNAIEEATADRSPATRAKLNALMEGLTGRENKAPGPVYLGKGADGSRRIAVYSKKLEKGLGGWTVASIPAGGGKFNLDYDPDDLDAKPRRDMTLGELKKLPGYEDALRSFKIAKGGKDASAGIEF